MKKTIYLFIFFLIPFLGKAQEKKTIKVPGRAIHIDKELTFKSTVSLNATYSSYSSDAISLKEMKSRYDDALKQNGLSLADLKEDPSGYIYLGQDKAGTLYNFKTTSVEKFNRFLKSKSFSLQFITNGYSIVISKNEAQIVIAKAIENAKEQAKIIAEIANKKLGDILKVEDNNLINVEIKNQPIYYNLNIGEYVYDVSVIFELIDK